MMVFNSLVTLGPAYGYTVVDLGIFRGGFSFRKFSITVIPLSYSPAVNHKNHSKTLFHS